LPKTNDFTLTTQVTPILFDSKSKNIYFIREETKEKEKDYRLY
jgi:hypothetical protein